MFRKGNNSNSSPSRSSSKSPTVKRANSVEDITEPVTPKERMATRRTSVKAKHIIVEPFRVDYQYLLGLVSGYSPSVAKITAWCKYSLLCAFPDYWAWIPANRKISDSVIKACIASGARSVEDIALYKVDFSKNQSNEKIEHFAINGTIINVDKAEAHNEMITKFVPHGLIREGLNFSQVSALFLNVLPHLIVNYTLYGKSYNKADDEKFSGMESSFLGNITLTSLERKAIYSYSICAMEKRMDTGLSRHLEALEYMDSYIAPATYTDEYIEELSCAEMRKIVAMGVSMLNCEFISHLLPRFLRLGLVNMFVKYMVLNHITETEDDEDIRYTYGFLCHIAKYLSQDYKKVFILHYGLDKSIELLADAVVAFCNKEKKQLGTLIHFTPK